MASLHPEASPPPSLGGAEPTCVVHHLEEALRLTEALHLTSEQRSKITELTKKQCEQSKALCAKEHELHQATHVQILAILSSEQQETLHGFDVPSPGPRGPREGGPGGPKGPGHDLPAAVKPKSN